MQSHWLKYLIKSTSERIALFHKTTHQSKHSNYVIESGKEAVARACFLPTSTSSRLRLENDYLIPVIELTQFCNLFL